MIVNTPRATFTVQQPSPATTRHLHDVESGADRPTRLATGTQPPALRRARAPAPSDGRWTTPYDYSFQPINACATVASAALLIAGTVVTAIGIHGITECPVILADYGRHCRPALGETGAGASIALAGACGLIAAYWAMQTPS